MQTTMICIALMLCLLEWAFAHNIPIHKEIDGQEDEGKNIIANALVGNREVGNGKQICNTVTGGQGLKGKGCKWDCGPQPWGKR